MHPINKEFLTPADLRAQAEAASKASRSFVGRCVATAQLLAGVAKSKRVTAQRLQDEIDLKEEADRLEGYRASCFTSTSAAPYGQEVRA